MMRACRVQIFILIPVNEIPGLSLLLLIKRLARPCIWYICVDRMIKYFVDRMYGADLISKTAGPIICHKAAALGPDRQPLCLALN